MDTNISESTSVLKKPVSVASALLFSLRCDFCSNGYAKRFKSCPLCGFPHRQSSALAVGFGMMALLQGFRKSWRSGGDL